MVDGRGRVVTTIFAAAIGSGSGTGFGVPDSVVRDALRPGGTAVLTPGPAPADGPDSLELRLGPPRHIVLAVLLPAALAAPAQAAKPPNPCLDAAQREQLLCPDLVMTKPFGLRLDRRVNPGRVVLRAGNSIDNLGLGPAELYGVRTSASYMRARQRIYRRDGGPPAGHQHRRAALLQVRLRPEALLEVPLRGEVRALAAELPGAARRERYGAARR